MTSVVTSLALEIIKKGNVRSKLTELDRLGYIVRKIDHECALVPYPSKKSTLTGELINYHGFAGLKPEELSKLESYRHYRESSEETRLRIYGRRLLHQLRATKRL